MRSFYRLNPIIPEISSNSFSATILADRGAFGCGGGGLRLHLFSAAPRRSPTPVRTVVSHQIINLGEGSPPGPGACSFHLKSEVRQGTPEPWLASMSLRAWLRRHVLTYPANLAFQPNLRLCVFLKHSQHPGPRRYRPKKPGMSF
jgi:hypothetical protein